MKIRKKASRLNLLIVFLLAVAAFCQAATVLAAYPDKRPGQRIYDLASLLSPEQEAQLEKLTAQVAARTTAELNVVTVNSLYGESVEKYANNLFNEWAIGRADINNGVLFLIAPHERKVRIEVGYGLESLLTDVICSSIILEYIIPSFKAEQFGQGIIIGAERIAGVLRQHPDQAGEVKDSAPKINGHTNPPFKAEQFDQGLISGDEPIAGVIQQHPDQAGEVKDSAPKFLRTMRRRMPLSKIVPFIPLGIGAFLLAALLFVRFRKSYPFWLLAMTAPASLFVLFLVYLNLKAQFPNGVSEYLRPFVTRGDMTDMLFWTGSFVTLFPAIINIAKYIRFRPRRCKVCGTWMVLLHADEKGSRLDEGERCEEELGSVEHDVWLCRSCDHHEKNAVSSSSTVYKECPKCKYRTVKGTIVRQATTHSSGLARMTCTYAACNYGYDNVIPKVVHSSSGSGSSSSSSPGGSGSSASSGSSSSSGSRPSSSRPSGSSSSGSGPSSSKSSGGSSGGGGASGSW